MHVTIEYCTVWNYEPRAAGLAAEIRAKHSGAEVELIPSGGGRFEVAVDGKLVFSKAKLRRHAEKGEILKLMRAGNW